MLLSADSSLSPQQLSSDEAKPDQMKAGIHTDKRKQEEWKWEVLLGTLAPVCKSAAGLPTCTLSSTFLFALLDRALFLLFGVFFTIDQMKTMIKAEEAVRAARVGVSSRKASSHFRVWYM